jgi:HEAT repeat protein
MQLRRILTVTSLALAPFALAPLAAAQGSGSKTPPKPAPQQPAQQPPKAATPRELFERAAYAEEHEHDFEKALAGFAAAEEAAKKAGDAKLAAEARTAHARVLARQGKGPSRDAGTETVSVQAERLLAEGAQLPSDDARLARTIEDLRIFGRTVVPVLERVLTESDQGEIQLEEYRLERNPDFASRVLQQLEVPEAIDALVRGLDSRDPLVRKAIVEHAFAPRNVPVWTKALNDPVPEIRKLAMLRVTQAKDAPRELVIAAARTGDERALAWLANNDPEAALALIERGEVRDPEQRAGILRNARWRKVTPELVSRVGVLRRGADVELVRGAAEESLVDLIKTAKAPMPTDVADALIAQVEVESSPGLISLLERVQPPERVFEVALTCISAASTPLTDDVDQAWAARLWEVARVTPDPVPTARWVELYAAARRLGEVSRERPKRPNVLDTAVAGIKSTDEAKDARRALLSWFQTLGPAEHERHEHALGELLSDLVKQMESERQTGPVEPPDPAFLPWIALVVADETPYRDRAWIAVELLDDPAWFERALDQFVKGPSQGATNCARSLAQSHPEHAAAVLEARIRSTADGSRAPDSKIVDAIGWLPPDRGLALAKKLLEKLRDEPTRAAVLWRLAHIPGAEATQLAQQLYATIPGSEGRLKAEFIQRFANDLWEPAIPLLGGALRDSDKDVREAAQRVSALFKAHREALEEFEAWTQASRDARTSIDELRALLASDKREIVLGAVKALGVVKARTALPELVKLLGREDAELRKAVQEAIDKIGQ